VTRLRVGRPNSIPGRVRVFRHRFQTATGAHPASYLMGTGESSPGVKVSEGEGGQADNSHPFSVEVNAWSYTSTPPYIFTAWYSVKHRNNFTFTSLYNFARSLVMTCPLIRNILFPISAFTWQHLSERPLCGRAVCVCILSAYRNVALTQITR